MAQPIDKVRSFVRLAFAHGAAERLDEREKWLLVRYIDSKKPTFKGISQYARVTTGERVKQLYCKALTVIWEASPSDVQRQFPKEELLSGKKGYPISQETRDKMIAALRTQEVRAKISHLSRRKGRELWSIEKK